MLRIGIYLPLSGAIIWVVLSCLDGDWNPFGAFILGVNLTMAFVNSCTAFVETENEK